MALRNPPAFLGKTAIAGVGYSPFSRSSGRSVLSLATEAVRNAILDAGLPTDQVDGLSGYMWEGDSVPVQSIATSLALPEVTYLVDVQMGGQAPCNLVMQAAMAIEAGLASNVVVVRAMNGRSGSRVGTAKTRGGSAGYRYPVGLSAYAQLIALWARRYMIETGCTEEDLSIVPLSQRRYAEKNDRAIIRRPLSPSDYLASPYVAEPFRVADCTTEVDGACAVLVTSLSRARDLKRKPAVIKSAAYAIGPQPGLDASDFLLWQDFSRNCHSFLADRLWRWAGMSPTDIDVAELYDCFSSSVFFGLEGLGIAERGGAAEFVRKGVIPINTHGGLLCEGYLHGMNTLAEGVLQVQGRAGPNQVSAARTCVVTSGALMDGSAMVLEAE